MTRERRPAGQPSAGSAAHAAAHGGVTSDTRPSPFLSCPTYQLPPAVAPPLPVYSTREGAGWGLPQPYASGPPCHAPPAAVPEPLAPACCSTSPCAARSPPRAPPHRTAAPLRPPPPTALSPPPPPLATPPTKAGSLGVRRGARGGCREARPQPPSASKTAANVAVDEPTLLLPPANAHSTLPPLSLQEPLTTALVNGASTRVGGGCKQHGFWTKI